MINKETKARRELDTAREELADQIRMRRALIAGLAISMSTIPIGLVLAFVAHGSFVVLSVIGLIISGVFTICAVLSTTEDVTPARSALRQAQWAYEDAILGQVGDR
ncbi:hypothetical protein [Rhodococcus qingshengii]|uniref:hypothetical protein n=1 Tax=Rhodococcus qingshengii TaxID=334542 RepID=UPI002AFE4CF4|nr:hypothetical protein [Rhodococcus qingshengii]MEA1798510.1 hypothetical protein [Rhodococcus qingshengii]